MWRVRDGQLQLRRRRNAVSVRVHRVRRADTSLGVRERATALYSVSASRTNVPSKVTSLAGGTPSPELVTLAPS